MDLMMPNLDGIEATARIKAAHPELEVVALTSFIEEARVVAAIEAGASGFLLKDARGRRARHRDPRGGGRRGPSTRPSRGSSRDACERLAALTGGRARRRIREPHRPRARRPRSCRARIAEPAAEDLGITERTARTHVSNILAKLGLASRTQAALLAVQRGLDREADAEA